VKILLDECLPVDFRLSFPQHETHTAEWAGFKSHSNGALLKAAEEAGYDVLLTVDHGLTYQNNFTDRRIAVVAIRAKTNQLEDLVPLVERISEVLAMICPGEIVRVA
jgi:hypothetical protein